MWRLAQLGLSLACFFVAFSEAAAQEPSMVPADLKFTRDISTRFHLVIRATLHLHDGTAEEFQYDRYPQMGLRAGVERIKKSTGVFARLPGQKWMRSDDWGATGSAADEEKTRELDSDVNVVAAPFRPPTNHDSTQGATVWRYVGTTSHGDVTDYTFEESREHPKPDGGYPRYTFLKAPGDTDGRLFLCGVTANLRDDSGIIPISLRLTYLVPVAAGTQVRVYDKDTGKEKLNTVTGPDSGWEITTPSSEPPVAK